MDQKHVYALLKWQVKEGKPVSQFNLVNNNYGRNYNPLKTLLK